ncbi:hypothetical protein FPQ18DRAFT_139973 [Pyronema domesticum]|nr:hypothetical protein FPQ18DRAFT_139973 [Pyronema domesticum]
MPSYFQTLRRFTTVLCCSMLGCADANGYCPHDADTEAGRRIKLSMGFQEFCARVSAMDSDDLVAYYVERSRDFAVSAFDSLSKHSNLVLSLCASPILTPPLAS